MTTTVVKDILFGIIMIIIMIIMITIIPICIWIGYRFSPVITEACIIALGLNMFLVMAVIFFCVFILELDRETIIYRLHLIMAFTGKK